MSENRSIYESLGVRRIVNAAGPVTRLGGHRLAPEVVAAMAEAAQGHVQIDELQARAGDLLAEATGAEAGLVTAGAAAGLTLATAACLAGFDPARMDSLPFVPDGRNEIVVQRGHRNAYDHAIRAAGARFVEVGYLGYPGAGTTYPWQIEAAITGHTVAVACPVMETPGTVPLAEVAAVAHRHSVPVIVDAAAALPPRDNLRRFIREGAYLVVYSGGKAIGVSWASGSEEVSMTDEADAVEARMKPKEPIPAFKSREEEAEFWDTHDFADYWGEGTPVEVRFAEHLSDGITIRLDTETMQRLEQEARERGIRAHALVTQWVMERLRGDGRVAS